MKTIVTTDLVDLYSTLKSLFCKVKKVYLTSTEVYIVQISGEDVLITNMNWERAEVAKNIAEVNCAYPISLLVQAINGASLYPNQVNIGDIGIITSAIQYDIDYTAIGYPIGYINQLDKSVLYSSKNLISYAKKAAEINKKNYTCGRSLSADVFMASDTVSLQLREKFNASYLDINSSPVLQMSYLYNIPSALFTGISDFANNNAPVDYEENREQSTLEALKVAITFVRMLIKSGINK